MSACNWTLEEQRDAIARREITPSELIFEHRERARRLQPQLRAFVRMVDEEDFCRGPLAGVPLTVKDSFDMEGLPTLTGSVYRNGHRAASDSTAVRRLRRAGAVIIGKTNCPEFLANYETDNHITGWTANPWNLKRTAGGSSGGEAAAIAAGCSAGGVGSDGGGSIRVPAHCCGIVGLKPTPGRVSAAGHHPEIAHPGGLLGVAGPMARTVRDVEILFQVLAGYDTQDPFSAPVELREPDVRAMRIGFVEQRCDPAIGDVVARAGIELERMGHGIEGFDVPGIDRAGEVWDFFFNTLPDALKRQVIDTAPEKAHWTGLELLKEDRPRPGGIDVLTQLAVRDKMRGAVLRAMADVPVLISAPCAIPAWAYRERPAPFLETMRASFVWNLFGFPALVLPFGFTPEGLPVGVQLIGRPWEEETLLSVGRQLEEARGPFPLPPER